MWNTPLDIRGLRLKNRIIKAATHDGTSFEEMADTYVRLARGQVAMITVAYVSISQKNKTFDTQHHVGADNMDDWTTLCRRVHQIGGAKMCAQLHHPGLFNMSSDGIPMGPSAFWLPSKLAWPRAMSSKDLDDVKTEYVAAAKRCVACGFDAIELHCGHGYLLSQFLTPMINRRRDAYGGSAANRARYPTEILRAIRREIGESVPIFVKMNGKDGLMFGGLNIEDALIAARLFARTGACDAIVVSEGYTSLNGFGMLRGNVPREKMELGLRGAVRGAGGIFLANVMRIFGRWLVPSVPYESLFLRHVAKQFVEALREEETRIIYVGGADSLSAIETVLESDGCAAVQLARPLLREPDDFLKRLQRGPGRDETDVRSKCIRCNMCTLASINPEMYKAGCIFADPPLPIEDIEDTMTRGAKRRGDLDGARTSRL
eukprot:g2626.t1